MYPQLKSPLILLFGETLLWETTPVFLFAASNNKPFILPGRGWGDQLSLM